jgi:hypothetical protein
MESLTTNAQVRAYGTLRSLEGRSDAIAELIAAMKQRCLYGGPAALVEIVAAATDLRANLRCFDENAAAIEAMLTTMKKGEPATDRWRDAREQPSFRGTTDALSVGDLVSLLNTTRKTGTLTLQTESSLYVFEFEEGAVVHAVTNAANPEFRLGAILVAQGKLPEDRLRQCLEASARGGELLGDRLLRLQLVSAADLRAALEVQVRRIFDAVFALPGARFTFTEGPVSEIAERSRHNTVHLLLEAARQCDEKQLEAAGAVQAKMRALDTILPG